MIGLEGSGERGSVAGATSSEGVEVIEEELGTKEGLEGTVARLREDDLVSVKLGNSIAR